MRVEVEYSPELVVTEMFVNSRQGEEEVRLVLDVELQMNHRRSFHNHGEVLLIERVY